SNPRAEDPYFFNAYALPGGYVVVGRGLLEWIASEDELAAVLGHEIAHVDDRHSIARLQYELASRKLGLGDLYALGAPAVDLFKAGYAKDQELEADRDGLGFAVAAGYSPVGALDLMKRFEKLESDYSEHAASPIGEFAEVPFSALVEYFRSHPPAAERLAMLQREIGANGWNTGRPVRPFEIRPIFLTDAAERLNRSGDFRESLAKLKQAIAINPNYTRAWQALGDASWRSGDALATVHAESNVVRQSGATDHDWQLLARGLAVSDPDRAVQRLEQILANHVGTEVSAPSSVPSIDLDGMRFLRGDERAAADFEASLSSVKDVSAQADARCEMAWWMYRAGQPQAAEQQLEQARQMLPQSSPAAVYLVWVLTDLGRQADAEQMLASVAGGQYSRGQSAELAAERAVLKWRTDQRDQAKQDFQAAARDDPVWMSAAWVQNSRSPSAAKVLMQ